VSRVANEAEIVAACNALSIAYARHVDFGDYAAFVDLFTEDGCLEVGPPIHGREKMRKAMSRRPAELRSRHVLTNIFIDVLSEREATGISYLTLYRHIGPESLGEAPVEFRHPAGVGHYEDRFALTDDGWRIAHRKLYFAFTNPELTG